MPKANYTSTPQQIKLVCQWMKELRMPDGYSLNFTRSVDVEKERVHGMKGHVFIECPLPIAFSSL